MLSERYSGPPRITSSHTRTIYEELSKIADHMDFQHPRFEGRYKRSRSIGSAQAFIVELALTDYSFLQRLKLYMLHRGKYWVPVVSYQDKYGGA